MPLLDGVAFLNRQNGLLSRLRGMRHVLSSLDEVLARKGFRKLVDAQGNDLGVRYGPLLNYAYSHDHIVELRRMMQKYPGMNVVQMGVDELALLIEHAPAEAKPLWYYLPRFLFFCQGTKGNVYWCSEP